MGTISTSYLVRELKLPEAGYIDSDLTPQVIVVHGSKLKHPIRIFGQGDLAALLSEVPLNPELSFEPAVQIVKWAKKKNTKLIMGITSVPLEGRKKLPKDVSSSVKQILEEWMAPARKEHFNRSQEMLRPLRRLFHERHFSWKPYIY